MVTEWLLGIATWLGELVLGMMPDTGAEDLVSSASGIISNVVSMGSGITIWFPWAVAGMAGLAVYTAWGAMFVLKIVRQLLAHVPQIGGSG